MIKVALTGNIASGKTTVQSILERYGYKVLDTDKTAHVLLDELEEIKEAFADFDIVENGKVSRSRLGQIVFDSPGLKKKLEDIIHPAVKRKILGFFEENKNEDLVFTGIPLLFESGMQNIFDKSLLIYTDDNLREKRLISRNHFSVEYAHKRMSAQMSQDEKKELCDYVIYNNGTIEELEISVKSFLALYS